MRINACCNWPHKINALSTINVMSMCSLTCNFVRVISHDSKIRKSVFEVEFTRVKSPSVFANRAFFGDAMQGRQRCPRRFVRISIVGRSYLVFAFVHQPFRSSKCHFSPSPHLLYSLDEQTREVTTMPSGLPFDACTGRIKLNRSYMFAPLLMRSIPLIRWRC